MSSEGEERLAATGWSSESHGEGAGVVEAKQVRTGLTL